MSTVLPGSGWSPPAPSAVPYRPPASQPALLVPVAVALVVVGAVGGYLVGRHAGFDLLRFAAFLWWTGSAAVLALLAHRAPVRTAVVTLFLFLFVGTPVVAYATIKGATAQAIAVITDQFEQFGETFGGGLGGGVGG